MSGIFVATASVLSVMNTTTMAPPVGGTPPVMGPTPATTPDPFLDEGAAAIAEARDNQTLVDEINHLIGGLDDLEERYGDTWRQVRDGNPGNQTFPPPTPPPPYFSNSSEEEEYLQRQHANTDIVINRGFVANQTGNNTVEQGVQTSGNRSQNSSVHEASTQTSNHSTIASGTKESPDEVKITVEEEDQLTNNTSPQNRDPDDVYDEVTEEPYYDVVDETNGTSIEKVKTGESHDDLAKDPVDVQVDIHPVPGNNSEEIPTQKVNQTGGEAGDIADRESQPIGAGGGNVTVRGGAAPNATIPETTGRPNDTSSIFSRNATSTFCGTVTNDTQQDTDRVEDGIDYTDDLESGGGPPIIRPNTTVQGGPNMYGNYTYRSVPTNATRGGHLERMPGPDVRAGIKLCLKQMAWVAGGTTIGALIGAFTAICTLSLVGLGST